MTSENNEKEIYLHFAQFTGFLWLKLHLKNCLRLIFILSVKIFSNMFARSVAWLLGLLFNYIPFETTYFKRFHGFFLFLSFDAIKTNTTRTKRFYKMFCEEEKKFQNVATIYYLFTYSFALVKTISYVDIPNF